MDAVHELMKHGADIAAVDELKETALVYAVFSTIVDVTTALIQHGAVVNAYNQRGRAALILAANKDMVDMIHVLLENGAVDEIVDITGRWRWCKQQRTAMRMSWATAPTRYTRPRHG